MFIKRISQQFVIAEKYLVAPAVEEGTEKLRVYLPGESNCWREYFKNEKRVGGSYVEVSVSLSEVSFWELVDMQKCSA